MNEIEDNPMLGNNEPQNLSPKSHKSDLFGPDLAEFQSENEKLVDQPSDI